MGKNYCKIENKWCKFLKHEICGVIKDNLKFIDRCPRLVEIETTRLFDLLKDVEFETVFTKLCFWFSDQEKSEEGYRDVFNKLQAMTPKKHNLNDLFISIQKENDDGIEYLHVHGIHVIGNDDGNYGLEFCEWVDWVSMYITKETLDLLSKEEIVAGCLYEMTFFGFTEDRIKQELDKMENSIKNVS